MNAQKPAKMGRPKKPQTGKNIFIPAHLVKYVLAMIQADKKEVDHEQH